MDSYATSQGSSGVTQPIPAAAESPLLEQLSLLQALREYQDFCMG